ncbi:unnamed protein product, partial [Darwinula stevensoni]
MNLIDSVFSKISEYLQTILGDGPLSKLISEGLIPGIGGIIIFIPQISILFLFLTLMEESGYMSRVVYLMDRWMKPAGLSGKSVVPLISGVACAIPAVLAARNIENSKERLLTILVTPFMTCSARLPVYAIIISIVIPRGEWWLFNYQGNYGPNDFNKSDTSKTTLENSFLGIFGHFIEPTIKPLGYDWKIGIGLISSFAAREVFVPTMATIYNIQNTDNQHSLISKMKNEKNFNTQTPTFTFASGISLLLFYAFAMQCLSTLAVVKKETNSWKWPLFQYSENHYKDKIEGKTKIGVFVNDNIDEITNKIKEYNLNGIQLHGDENPEFCKYFKNNNILTIKAFGIDKDFDFDELKLFE